MSFLTPLYALGLLAVAGPIIFHLIRRAPRTEVPFSSLMFLAPSPPRLTRRSRLDQVLLLLLRASAIALLAFAFARPFFRRPAQLESGDVERRRVAVLLDTSASMRRGTLWARARALADAAIASCRPADQLAVFTFDATPRPVLGFAESAALEPSKRLAVARARLDRLSPRWGATQLGQALIEVAAAIEDVADATEKSGRMPRRIVLVSDLQQGSRLEGLGAFEWPSDVELELKTVADDAPNAGLHRIDDPTEGPPAEAGATLRVRVSNDPASPRERFSLAWVDPPGGGKPSGPSIEVYVPPGESRVVRVPAPRQPSTSRALRLSGDAHAFDNTVYFAEDRREESTVLFVGKEGADDPAGLLYYLDRVFEETPRRKVRVVSASPSSTLEWKPGQAPALVVVAAETSPANLKTLRGFAEGGGTVLEVVLAPGLAPTIAGVAGVPPPKIEEAAVARDVLLGAIAFDHPLFASLAGPQFNDFTKIHFWKYRRLDPAALGAPRVLARFENGDPALVEKPVGKGRLVVLTSGWQPSDSQLARSSKFVALMTALLEGNTPPGLDSASLLVLEPVPLPALESGASSRSRSIRKPDGAVVTVGADRKAFDEADLPGVYSVADASGTRSFAVNLDPSESKTAPLAVESLEQLGCRLADRAARPADRELLRQLHNAELEGRQKLWRWTILAALGVLIVETWLAGRLVRPRTAPAEALST